MKAKLPYRNKEKCRRRRGTADSRVLKRSSGRTVTSILTGILLLTPVGGAIPCTSETPAPRPCAMAMQPHAEQAGQHPPLGTRPWSIDVNHDHPVLAAARDYCRCGLFPIPISAPVNGDENSGKRPSLPRWQDLRIGLDEVGRCFADPTLNVGILTGDPSRIVVLDFDEGQAYHEWARRHPEAAQTYTVARDNAEPGRCHVYFVVPPGYPLPKNVPKSRTGWGDLLSTGRQVVAPPSRHHTGGQYCVVIRPDRLVEWRDEYLPESLVSQQQDGAKGAQAASKRSPENELAAVLPDDMVRLIENGVTQGGRNDAAFRLACRLRDRGFDAENAGRLVQEFAARCVPPLPPTEVNTTVASAFKAEVSAQERTADRPPWEQVTAAHVRDVIRGTLIEPVVEALEAVTTPPLPLEMTLPKALTLIGCALSQPVHTFSQEFQEWVDDPIDERPVERGLDLARLVIRTAGGQVCNVWALIAAPSGSGKDIGGVVDRLAAHFRWHIGTNGSAEGLADEYRMNGGGLLSISEFAPWLDRKHWQHSAQSFLIAAPLKPSSTSFSAKPMRSKSGYAGRT